VERQFQVVERQTQVVERRSGPLRLNLTTALSTRCPPKLQIPGAAHECKTLPRIEFHLRGPIGIFQLHKHAT